MVAAGTVFLRDVPTAGHDVALEVTGAGVGVVVLTTYADDDWVFRALEAGARGFLTKDAGAEEIQQATDHLTGHPRRATISGRGGAGR